MPSDHQMPVSARRPWNGGQLIGQKRPLKPKVRPTPSRLAASPGDIAIWIAGAAAWAGAPICGVFALALCKAEYSLVHGETL